MTKENTSLS